MSIFYTLMGVGLFAPIIGGLYVRRARTSDAMCAIVAGVGTVAVLHFGYVGQRVLGLTPTRWPGSQLPSRCSFGS